MNLINPDIISYFHMLGFTMLTRIQKKSLMPILQKKDTLVIAPTGSGKTESAIVPIFYHILKSKQIGKIKALYITPLKSLNRDVFKRIIKHAKIYNLSINVRHGDTTTSTRKYISNNPPDILITTPETLVALLIQKKMLLALSELEWVVIDEIHELLNSKRGTQLSLALERLTVNSQLDITRIGLSATIKNTIESAKFLVGSKRKFIIVQDKSQRQYNIKIKYINGTIGDSANYIINFLSNMDVHSPILLFTNTRAESELMASILKEKSDFNIELHHGSLSRIIREETEYALRENKTNVVVCTSSMELGIDIPSVELVIQYGSPKQVLKLIQRIGRSKHGFNSPATGLIIVNNVDDEFESKALVASIKSKSLEEQKIHVNALDVLAHNIVGLVIQLGKLSVREAFDISVKAYPFRTVNESDFLKLINLLKYHKLINYNKDMINKNFKSFRYYFDNISTIVDVIKFKVFDTINKKIIGTLDQKFVAIACDYGNIFVLRGTQWRIINIDDDELKINVEQFNSGETTIPYWEGENIPIDYIISQKVAELRTKSNLELFKLKSNSTYDIPNEKTIVIEAMKNVIILHACFGTKTNSALATLLSSMISSLSGFLTDSSSDAYRIVISSKSIISQRIFTEILFDKYDLNDLIRISLVGTHNLNWKTWCMAKKFGVLENNMSYNKKTARFIYEKYQNTEIVHEAIRELLHDKFDIKNLESLLFKIRSHDILLKWHDVDHFSDLSKPVLNSTARYYSSPSCIDKGILNTVKNRLYENKHRLICVRCGVWQLVASTKEIPKTIFCPYCKSRQITATFYSDHELQKIIQKKHDGKKMSKNELIRFNKAWKISSLIESFGQIALLVLSGYGIGVDTAARILKNMVDSTILYEQIYQAERQYIITKGFWN